ncbi:hypothetical protein Tam10B_1283 [Bifidobacterium vansinderenii]|uniref:Uncharacterized protein n=2 Tax=Bifidobacterium vansinderenii TaxID=1984871 RepID=A0A229VXR6_9BIFI|nr:hypothetical protein Tam10B_1283 [Bifidobacterium vansinderenii]
MARYHLTPEGPKRCTASVRPCRYGEHYSDLGDAMDAFEERVAAEVEAESGDAVAGSSGSGSAGDGGSGSGMVPGGPMGRGEVEDDLLAATGGDLGRDYHGLDCASRSEHRCIWVSDAIAGLLGRDSANAVDWTMRDQSYARMIQNYISLDGSPVGYDREPPAELLATRGRIIELLDTLASDEEWRTDPVEELRGYVRDDGQVTGYVIDDPDGAKRAGVRAAGKLERVLGKLERERGTGIESPYDDGMPVTPEDWSSIDTDLKQRYANQDPTTISPEEQRIMRDVHLLSGLK